jgi:hypothetical protein
MAKKQVFVEPRDEGGFAVRRGGSKRASAVAPTQAKAIEKAKELEPDVAPDVARVRHTSQGHPDQWRTA